MEGHIMPKSFSEKPRPWAIEDLYNRRAYMRAVPILVLEKWEREKGRPHADCLSTHEIHDELVARGLLDKPLSPQGAGNLVHGFRQKQEKRNLYPPFVEEPFDRGIWRFNVDYYEDLLREFRMRYPIKGEGAPTPARSERKASVEKPSGVQSRPLTNKIFRAIQEYETDWQQRLQEFERRVKSLEQENDKLRKELEKGLSNSDEIIDEALKKRLSRLGSPPLDTLIREAGVVLEDRLRTTSGADSNLHGKDLVEAVLGPGKGMLIFSSHPGEQDGVRMLYRGAMQFIRNPPMHKLVEYPESTARLFIRLIDSLLQLLSEIEPRQRGEVTVDDIRRVLTRRRLPNGQLALYNALYSAGEHGLSSSDLAVAMNRSRDQISGVLGALGRRINNTEGLEGKGGIQVILDISEGDDGDWRYCMRPILRQALEAENIV